MKDIIDNNKSTGPAVHGYQPGTLGELNYHSLFEQTTDAILVSDFNGDLKDVNCSLCKMFGYTKAELLTMNVRSLLDPHHIATNPIRFDLLAAGENLFTEREMVHRDGTIIFVEANSRKIMDNRILVIARNITARKNAERILQASEANLNTILDTTDTIYVLLDTHLRIISYNRRAKDFAKRELGHSFEISRNFLDYFPPEKRPALQDYMKETISKKDINYKVCYPQADQSLNWYEVKLFPISKGAEVYGIMMAVCDITEKTGLEQELEEERIRKQLEITDAVITAEENERQQISLELHDNVNQLMVSARLYLMSAITSGKKAHPSISEAQDLLDAAISEIRKLSHSLISPFTENNGLVEALDYLFATIQKNSAINIVEEIAGVNENDLSDKLKLAIYRIAQEQFNNILKYANADTVEFRLAQYKDRIMLVIKDNGVGFDTSIKPSGIGLMNIRTRASLFNGKVEINSSPGNGCELGVTFQIPRS